MHHAESDHGRRTGFRGRRARAGWGTGKAGRSDRDPEWRTTCREPSRRHATSPLGYRRPHRTNAAGSTTVTSTAHQIGSRPAPTLTATNPASPSTVDRRGHRREPSLRYRLSIKLYVNDADCSGAPAATSNVATFQGKGLVVDPLAVGSQIRATLTDPLGNVSACSAPLSYTRLPGPAPTLTATNPASPSTADRPKVIGTSPASGTGYRIKLYVNDADCWSARRCFQRRTFQGNGARGRPARGRHEPDPRDPHRPPRQRFGLLGAAFLHPPRVNRASRKSMR